MSSPVTLSVREARRLALVRAGLLRPDRTGLPARAAGGGLRARRAAHAVIGRFGYLQLDTISIAGARSHVLVLLSRLAGFDPALGEALLRPGEPLFEYWGHEASWLPLELYPLFEFRRKAFRRHPWWGDVLGQHRKLARQLLARVRDAGPIRSADLEGEGSTGWWQMKAARRVAAALWSSGELAIRERKGFQRSFDLAERVIPAELRARPVAEPEALRRLLLIAASGHGWATPSTLRATFRLRATPALARAFATLVDSGELVRCAVALPGGRSIAGLVRPADLELGASLGALRPRADRPVLLSPFDPVLWDRKRTSLLFGFEQRLEVFTPAHRRVFGYYCLPVLAGERLVGRVDLQAERRRGRLRVIAVHLEAAGGGARAVAAAGAEAARVAVARHAAALGLEPDPPV